VGELQPGGGEQQASAVEGVAEHAVVAAVAVGGVADNRMENVLHVATELTAATSLRLQFEQGIAAGRIAADRDGQLNLGQAAVEGDGGLGLALGIEGGKAVFFLVKGVIDCSLLLRNAAHHGEISFSHLARFEQDGQLLGDLAAQGEQQHAGGRFVEAMHRIDPTTDLIAHQLQGETGFVPVDGAAVHQQTGRFVHGHQVVVAVEDVEVLVGHEAFAKNLEMAFRIGGSCRTINRGTALVNSFHCNIKVSSLSAFSAPQHTRGYAFVVMTLKWDLSEAFAAVILIPMITWLASRLFRQHLDSRLRGNDENRPVRC